MKNSNTNIITALFIIAAAFGIPRLVNGKTWRVNNIAAYNSGPEVFNSLTAAIGDANVLPGDTLYLEASGTSYGTISLNKRLTIIGTGYYLADNAGKQFNQMPSTVQSFTFAAGSSGSTLMGVRVDGAGADVTLANTPLDSITVTRCFINGVLSFANGNGIVHNRIIVSKNVIGWYIGHAGGAPGTITNLIFTNNIVKGTLDFRGANHYGSVFNNVVTNGNVDIQAGITFFNNIVLAGSITQSNNSSTNMYNNLFSVTQPVWLTGGNNNFGVPSGTIFPANGTPDLIYDPNPIGICPQCYQGFPGGTTELGIFGGSDPYIPSGIPNIPTIYNLQTPGNAPLGGTMQGNVSTRSNN
jgi:hypothetical protein